MTKTSLTASEICETVGPTPLYAEVMATGPKAKRTKVKGAKVKGAKAQASNPQASNAQDVSMLLDDQLCFALYSAAHSIQRLYRPLLESLDLTYPQYLVLLVLWERDGLSVSEIGERLFLKSATVTPLLKRMESAGLIERRRRSDDERRLTVSLTSEGKALRAKVRKVTTDVTCAAVDASSDAGSLHASLIGLREGLPESL